MKRKLIFFIGLGLISVNCFAQNKWQFGASIAPEISAPYNPANIDRFSKKDYPRSRVGYNIGVVGFKGKRRWLYYQIGLHFTSTRFADVTPFEVVGSGRPIEPAVNIYQNLTVILPFNLHFRVIKPENKFGFVASIGPGIAWTVSQKREISTSWYYDKVYRKDLRISPDRLHVEARIGAITKLGDNRSLLIEPSVRLSVIDVLGKMNFIDETSRSFGVRLTIF